MWASLLLAREKKNPAENSMDIVDRAFIEKFRAAESAKEILELAAELEKTKENKKLIREMSKLLREMSSDVYRD